MTQPVLSAELVDAAVRVAQRLGKDVADVPVTAIAEEAGISRSTLLRRSGGSRGFLDAAVRAAGIDTGGRPRVRARALDAAAKLISQSGLAAATLEAVATESQCSVFSLHAAFGSRDELLRAVFEQFSPVDDVEQFLREPHGDLSETVRGLYRVVAHALNREPRVAPAMFAEAFSRPSSPAVQSLFAYTGPRMLGVLGSWFEAETRAGHVRKLPELVLLQQLLGPILIHMFMRPLAENVPSVSLPDLDTLCDLLAENFIRSITPSTT